MEQGNGGKEPGENSISYFLNGIFLRTVSSWGSFFADENGHIVEDWGLEDEPEDAGASGRTTR